MLDPNLEILVVDDYVAMRTIMKRQLWNMGYSHVCEASDGHAALEILKNKKIDLVISDWNMPRMTGYELLKEVRKDSELHSILFIMVTAETSSDNIALAIKEKVNQFIVKPFTLKILEDKINQVVH